MRGMNFVCAVGCVIVWSGQSLLAQEQDASDLVHVPVAWEVGDHYKIEVIKGKKSLEWKEGKWVTAPGAGESTSIYDVEILEERENGPLYRWTCEKVDLSKTAAPNNPIVLRLARMVVGQEIHIRGDEFGSVVALENGPQLSRFMRKAMDTMFSDFEGLGMPLESLGGLKENLEATMGNPALLEMTALKEPQLYYFMCGASLDPSKPAEYEDLLPNMFGGEPLPAKGSLQVASVDGSKAHLRQTQSIDSEKAGEYLKGVIDQLTKGLDIPGDQSERERAMREFKIDIADESLVIADTKSGVIESVAYTRTTKIATQQQIETIRMKRIDG